MNCCSVLNNLEADKAQKLLKYLSPGMILSPGMKHAPRARNSRGLHLTVIVLLRSPILVAKPLNVSMLSPYLHLEPADLLVLLPQLRLLSNELHFTCSSSI